MWKNAGLNHILESFPCKNKKLASYLLGNGLLRMFSLGDMIIAMLENDESGGSLYAYD